MGGGCVSGANEQGKGGASWACARAKEREGLIKYMKGVREKSKGVVLLD